MFYFWNLHFVIVDKTRVASAPGRLVRVFGHVVPAFSFQIQIFDPGKNECYVIGRQAVYYELIMRNRTIRIEHTDNRFRLLCSIQDKYKLSYSDNDHVMTTVTH